MIDLENIARTIESQTCKVHGGHPRAEVAGQDIQLSTCCEPFRQRLEAQIETEVTKAIEATLGDLFKNFETEPGSHEV